MHRLASYLPGLAISGYPPEAAPAECLVFRTSVLVQVLFDRHSVMDNQQT
jgi:hypothetical protein